MIKRRSRVFGEKKWQAVLGNSTPQEDSASSGSENAIIRGGWPCTTRGVHARHSSRHETFFSSKYPPPEREFLLVDGPGGPAGAWELAFLFWRRGLFFARKREKIGGFFLSVFGGVFALFGGDFAFFWGDFAFFGGCFLATRQGGGL